MKKPKNLYEAMFVALGKASKDLHFSPTLNPKIFKYVIKSST